MRCLRHWLAGCLWIFAAEDVTGLTRLSRIVVLRLRFAALADMLADRRLRVLLWLVLAGMLLAQSYCWRQGLTGQACNILVAAPLLLAAPCVLRAHRLWLIRRLRRTRLRTRSQTRDA